ncbi:unnamed protein product [Mytilus coruscus]|uniref:Uncharacterized protein n=1 Tax=Mytilus coruscus TaxID=42192 RepID=A0A6J8BXE4_MYTCO|nr:unnamed protein product [Mytilus coruscus]
MPQIGHQSFWRSRRQFPGRMLDLKESFPVRQPHKSHAESHHQCHGGDHHVDTEPYSELVLRQAREDSREQRQRYVERLADIRQQRQEALAMKREKKEAKEQRDRAKKEELTQKLQEVGGLWKTPSEIDRQLLSLQSGQRVKALQTQLTFRRQKRRSFRNLQKKKGRETQRLQRKGRRHKVVSSRAVPNTPAPDKPEDLIGKRVQHLIEEFDGSSKWYYGIITGLKKACFLLDDMEKDELRIVPLDPVFIVGRRVDHRFCREADGEEFWYTGTVTGHDADTGLSTIAYDFEDGDVDDDDDDDKNSNVFEEPVIEDYKNGDVRILL